MSGVWHVAPVPASRSARIDIDLGSGLRLHLDERRIADRALDRRRRILLLGSEAPDGLAAVRLRGDLGSTALDESFEPTAGLAYTLTADETDPPESTPRTATVQIGWQFERRRLVPARTRWWNRSVLLGEWDARSAGLGGFTPTGYHRLEPATGTLWTGAGRRIDGVNVHPAASLPGRRPPGLGADDLVVVLDARVHVFDTAGRLRRTHDAVRGRALATFEHDEAGLLTGWTDRSPGADYRVTRGDTTVVIAPGGQWLEIVVDDAGRASSLRPAEGAPMTVAYGADGTVDAAEGPRGQRVELDHDPEGALTTWSDSTGRRLDVVVDGDDGSRRTALVTAGGREFSTVDMVVPEGRRRIRRCCGASAATVSTRSAAGTTVERPDGLVERRVVQDEGTRRLVRHTLRTPAGRSSTRVIVQTETKAGSELRTIVDGRQWVRSFERESGLLRSVTPTGRIDEIVLEGDTRMRVRRSGLAEVTTEFDMGVPTRIADGDRAVTFEHDDDGRLEAIDLGGDRREVHHDSAGRVAAMQLSTGWVRVRHDDGGDVVAMTTPTGAVHRFERATDGLVDAIVGPNTPAGHTEVRFGYDIDRQIVSRSVVGGATVHYERDAAGRVVAIRTDGTAIDLDVDDATGAVRSVADADGSVVEWEHDGPLPVRETATGTVAGTVELRYGDGFVPEARVIDGVELAIRRDGDGALRGLGPVEIERGLNGLVETIRVGAALTQRGYDQHGNLVTNRTTIGSAVVLDEEIRRDAHGRVTEVVETDASGTRTRVYEYAADGLAATTLDVRAELELERDAGGNPVRIARWGEAETITYDGADRIASVSGRPATAGPAGELLDDGSRRYGFDGLGRLRTVDRGDGPDTAHVHDGVGRLVRSTVDGHPYLGIVWDGQRPAAVEGMDGVRRICVVTGYHTAPEALLDGDRVLRLVTDHRGSVRAVVDATTGEELQRLDYDPLGRRTIDTSPGFQAFGFTGSVHDTYTGLVHLGRRVLDPGVGRFLTPDPLGFEGGQVNLYAYAGNDPVNRHDPSGTQSTSTGTVKVCTAPFMGSRPTSADHVFLEGKDFSRGTTFAPDAEGLEKITDQQWVDETTHPKGSADHPEKECQEVENVDEECLDRFTTPGTGTGPYGFGLKVPSPIFPSPVEINMCATDVWDALDACAGPGGWEYKEDLIDRTTGEGPGLVETVVRWARDAANYPETIWDWATN